MFAHEGGVASRKLVPHCVAHEQHLGFITRGAFIAPLEGHFRHARGDWARGEDLGGFGVEVDDLYHKVSSTVCGDYGQEAVCSRQRHISWTGTTEGASHSVRPRIRVPSSREARGPPPLPSEIVAARVQAFFFVVFVVFVVVAVVVEACAGCVWVQSAFPKGRGSVELGVGGRGGLSEVHPSGGRDAYSTAAFSNLLLLLLLVNLF
mmetsp:Transcript_61012/g.133550  ORF Transcript_61012/g.133550 Transcript_61012/m.133550 type:complete len:206 (+) Transcript_61012:640-1257(+)